MKIKTGGGPPLPYQYVLPIAKVQELVRELKACFDFDSVPPRSSRSHRKLQCRAVETKACNRGIRLSVWSLGYALGHCGPLSPKGVTKREWDDLCNRVKKTLVSFLGTKGDLLTESYKEGADEGGRFQLRFLSYIMYEELNTQNNATRP